MKTDKIQIDLLRWVFKNHRALGWCADPEDDGAVWVTNGPAAYRFRVRDLQLRLDITHESKMLAGLVKTCRENAERPGRMLADTDCMIRLGPGKTPALEHVNTHGTHVYIDTALLKPFEGYVLFMGENEMHPVAVLEGEEMVGIICPVNIKIREEIKQNGD